MQDLLPDPKRFLKKGFGFDVLPHRLVHQAQVIEGLCRGGMFGSENLLPEWSASWSSGSALAYSPITQYSTARLFGLAAMLGSLARDLVPDSERFLKERLGFGVLAHCLI